MKLDVLNIAQICPVSETLGPGRRFVLWVQGCPFSCRGCISPDWIEQRPAHSATVSDMAAYIIRVANSEKLEGITISGGEPMLQAAGLSSLLDTIRRELPDFSAIAFSGFTIGQLRSKARADQGIAALLSRLDVLIDGLYVEEKNDGKGMRGSSNQQVHFLKARYEQSADKFLLSGRAVEVHLLEGELLLVGVPSPKTLADFASMGKKLN